MLNSHFISLNVRGLRNKEKRSQIFKWSKHQKVDVLFLQETYWSCEIENIVRSEWRGPCFFEHGSNHSRGVSILFNDKLNVKDIVVKCRMNGQLLMLGAKIHDNDMILVNVYAPTEKQNRESFFRKLSREMYKHNDILNECELLLGGDWNCVLDTRKDVQGKKTQHYKRSVNLRRLIKTYSLIDVWRVMHPNDKQFTWRNLSLKRASRLDFWLVTKNVKRKTSLTDIRPAIRADHNAISIKICIKQNKKGPGYWKINNDVLNDKVYLERVHEIIQSFSKKCLSPILKWELFKVKVREFTQNYCRKKALERKDHKMLLEKKLYELEKQIDVNVNDEQLQNSYTDVKEKLEKIYKHESKGAGVRARIRWMEEGERSTKYFLGLEKNNAKKKEIAQLKCGRNRVINRNEDILEEVVKYYSKLYEKEKHDYKSMSDYICSQKISMLTNESKQTCEGLLTQDECKRAVFKMQKNKAPGSDGISIEFYQVFWSHIKDFLVEALNECYLTGVMSNTQRKGLITLLYKKGDCEELKNWRPITLLNCDYKIITAVLASRVQKIIGEIVHDNQTGYIKGRLAACNVRLTKDVIEYFMKHCKTGTIMLVDFTKAFDVLDIQFLNLCLEKFNFGESFRKWITILYSDIISSVLVNGWISKDFKVERGIRQGCPLSSLLFILAAEFLANSVRGNRKVKPIEIRESDLQMKLLQYADDTLFFVKDEQSLKEILNELHMFGNVAGPKINKEKTSLIWLGDSITRWNISQYDLLWTTKPVKYLGHYIHSNNKEALNLDWEQKLVKLRKILDSWAKRNLTIFGRVTVLKSLALSQVTHLIIVDSIPPKFQKVLDKIIFEFIWSKKVEKIKRCILTENYEKGGIRMVDIQNQMLSFRLKWLSRFLNESKETWKKMCSYWFDLIGGIVLLLNCNYSVSTFDAIDEKKIPTFYKEILYAWEMIRTHTTVQEVQTHNFDSNDALNQIIVWHNKDVLFDNRSLFFKEWYSSGIVYLGDLVRRGGFQSIENIRSKIRFEKSKSTVLFDYARLRTAIPLVWIKKIKYDNIPCLTRDHRELSIPSICVANKLKNVDDLNSKSFYKLLPSRNLFTNTCCLYWENKLNIEIDWTGVFKCNLVQIKENKLREFNLKLLYNLLPTRSNLFKWGLSSEDLCPNCKVKEDIIHAFTECDLNKSFFRYLENILQEIYHVKIRKVDIMHLLKIEIDGRLSLFLTLAFWSVYKLILERNKTGKDKRVIALKYVFERELRKRIEVQCHRKNRVRAATCDLPEALLKVII